MHKVEQWLRSAPATDNPHSMFENKNRATSWEEWIKQGKKIPHVEEILLILLKDKENNGNKAFILTAIGLVGSGQSFSDLLHFAKNSNTVIRMEAIAAMGNLKLRQAVSFLCESEKDPDRNVRANVYTALGKLYGTKAFQCLQHGLNDEDEFVRLAAQRAIEAFGA